MSNFRCSVSGVDFQVQGFGCRISGAGFRVHPNPKVGFHATIGCYTNHRSIVMHTTKSVFVQKPGLS